MDWENSGDIILNLIRAVAKPYPGAYTYVNGKKVTLWKASLNKGLPHEAPGTILKLSPESLLISLVNGLYLNVSDYETENGGSLEAGMRFDKP